MVALDKFRVLRNGKKYGTATNTNISEDSSSRSNPAMSIQSTHLIQADVNEQTRSFIVPLTKQLDELTRLMQVTSSAQQSNIYPRAGICVSFSAAGYPTDNGIIVVVDFDKMSQQNLFIKTSKKGERVFQNFLSTLFLC